MTVRTRACSHCGLPHEAQTAVCPTTGLKIDPVRRRRAGPAAADPDAGRIIDGRYRILGRLGSGGMSTVFEAEPLEPSSASRVAVKLLRPALADDPEAIARIDREAQLVQAIGHPNICPILALGRTAAGEPYLVMERLFGESLASVLRRGPVGFSEIEPILQQILAALGAAHAVGVLHRDLKPENIFIEDRAFGEPARAKLLDFGVAKSMAADAGEARLTDTGMVMGTPYYMAPEQARGEHALDQRVDLWAIGVILYQALSGRRPFVAGNYNALLVNILSARPKPLAAIVPGLAAAVAAIVDRAMSKRPEERFQTARELGRALSDCRIAGDDWSAPTERILRRAGRNAVAGRADPALPYRRRSEDALGRRSELPSWYGADEPEATIPEPSQQGEADAVRETTGADHDAADTVKRER